MKTQDMALDALQSGGASALGDEAAATMMKARAYQQEMLAESLRQNIIVVVGTLYQTSQAIRWKLTEPG